jgi:hypothetical protein
MLLYGTRSGDRRMARDGFWTILGALALFAVGLVFFEGIIGISGERLPLPNWVLPVAVIVIGVVVLLRGLTFRDTRGPAWGGDADAREAPVPASPAPGDGPPEAVATASAEEPPADG